MLRTHTSEVRLTPWMRSIAGAFAAPAMRQRVATPFTSTNFVSTRQERLLELHRDVCRADGLAPGVVLRVEELPELRGAADLAGGLDPGLRQRRAHLRVLDHHFQLAVERRHDLARRFRRREHAAPEDHVAR